jgi:c-di-GMP-binding flagellar brake protein YcgR
MASIAQKLPLCVALIGDDKLKRNFESELKLKGIQVSFVQNEKDLGIQVSKPEVFLVVADIVSFPWSLQYFRQRPTGHLEYWVTLSQKLKTVQSSALFNLGIVDVLTFPVHPFTLVGRVRLLLARFVKTFGMPEHVVLPQGIQRSPIKKPVMVLEKLPSKNGKPPPRRPYFVSGGKFGRHTVDVQKLQIFEKAIEQTGPTEKLFVPLSEKKKKYGLTELAKNKSDVTLWAKHQVWKEKLELDQISFEKALIFLKVTKLSVLDALRELISKKTIQELYVSCVLKTGKMFFAIPVSELRFESQRIIFRIPPKVFQVQRRDHLRLEHKGLPEVKLASPKFSFDNEQKPRAMKVLDIGAGGAQISVSSEIGLKLRRGQNIPHFEVTLYGQRIVCGAVIRWKKILKNNLLQPTEFRVGLKFLNLSEKDEEGLQLFVFEESLDLIKALAA